MLTQTAEHALRACLFLAGRPEGERVSADAIAAAVGAPGNYLAKTLKLLAREGIVSSLRGPTGGFRLEVPAHHLTVADLMTPFETPDLNPMCLLGERPCSERTPCRAHHRWVRTRREARVAFERTTIADLLAGEAPAPSAVTPPPSPVVGCGTGHG